MKNRFKQAQLKQIKKVVTTLSTSLDLSKLAYLPRWVVLSIDICILFISAVCTFFLLKGLTLNIYEDVSVPFRYGLLVAVNSLFFLLFRTFAGIIRHSTFIDAIKLLVSTFFGFGTLLLISSTSYFFTSNKIYLFAELLFNFVLNFSLLLLFRILVKSVFERFFSKSQKYNLITALVYGSDANAIAVANALKSEVPSRFKLVGFISPSNKGISKTILDVPLIQKNKRIPVLLRSYQAQALILADNQMGIEDKRFIVDDCLEAGFKVFTLPLISDWEDQKEISRKVQTLKIEDLLERKPIVLDKSKIEQQLQKKRVLVTGAAGSIGSEIVRQVLAFEPDEIILLDQAETPLHHLSLEIEQHNPSVLIHLVIKDIRNYAAMEKVFQTYLPQKVYHAAAYKHVPLMEKNPDQAVLVNVMGTKNLADLSVKYKVEKFVMVSTDKAVNPSNVMGASKRIAEKYVQSLFHAQRPFSADGVTKFITTRFGNVLGSNGSVVPLFSKQIAEGGPVTITHPEIIRYFMTIPEACQLVLEAGVMGKGGEIFLFDMGKPVRIIDLAKKMIRMAGFKPDIDIKIAITGLRPGEKLYEELLHNASKTLPTYHEKITIAQEPTSDCKRIPMMVDELITLAQTGSNVQVVQCMKEIVPEFISNNSEYGVLDITA
ncbi:polysaccharide biosynthesis protein [Flavobacterium lacus]|uniref:FlaA1/EpsC-like NDP-sugar epimerase n=1 Tax=Flavobacterium lacus TaxID=1353778 RepID=A0A328WV23_9FLAO|nr:nucleoside-diphosphate sugar epimerase/dehydratase [Flavobacterium lacus]RAR47218.1 FlaA1/EpsC-like NDP-sugar epimerase [Flavobacterium lacus]